MSNYPLNKALLCSACGQSEEFSAEIIEEYEYDFAGIRATLVGSVLKKKCRGCGHSVEVIPAQAALTAALALTRILLPLKLNAKEIRFVRKAMSLRGTDFASRLSIRPETLSRWESGKETMSPQSEKQLRFAAAVALMPKAPAIDVDLEDLVRLEFVSVRSDSASVVMRLELVKFKKGSEKQTSWDLISEAA